jgi:hypothetical protein
MVARCAAVPSTGVLGGVPVTTPRQVVIRERPGWPCLLAGAGLLGLGYILGVATPRPEILALATPPQQRQLVDVERVRVPGEEAVWSIRYVDPYDQVRVLQVSSEERRDAVLAWIGEGR